MTDELEKVDRPERLFLVRMLDSKSYKTLSGVQLTATSPTNGTWAKATNCAGEVDLSLRPGHYDVTFTKAGYNKTTRSWDLSDPPKDPILVGMEVDETSFPSYPTREQVCDIFCGFQGITIQTSQYGAIPAFGPETSSLSDEDLISYCQQMKALGFKHVEFDISWRYSEPDYSYPVPGRDLSNNVDEICRRCDLIIRQGMFIKMSLAGDGLSVGTPGKYGYNDPQGWTYGYEWLMENLGRIIFPMKNYLGHDLTKFICFVPGYDGVFYGWTKPESPDLQPQRVIDFGRHFRTLFPDGYLGIEHTPGKIPVGEGSDNWKPGGVLDAYDTCLSEFDPFHLHSDDTWQILGRMTRPFNRPPDMPANDDPNPDYYLLDCSRGKRFYIAYELVTYLWVRNHISLAECNDIYDYFKAMAPNATLCMVRQ